MRQSYGAIIIIVNRRNSASNVPVNLTIKRRGLNDPNEIAVIRNVLSLSVKSFYSRITKIIIIGDNFK